MSDEHPSLEKVIDQAITSRLTALNVMLPGKIVKVDVTKGKCDVQPLLKSKAADGTVKSRPVISGVPIGFYRAGNAFITLPVKIGDYVEIRFSQRSLDLWLTKGGDVDPLDPRKFHIKDAVAYPGLYPFTMPPVGASADDIIIQNTSASKVRIKPDGTIELEGTTAIKALADLVVLSGDSDAVALASKVMTELSALVTYINTHTHPYTNVAAPAVTSAPSVPKSAAGQVKSDKVKAE